MQMTGIDAELLGKATEQATGLPEEYNPLSPNNALATMFKQKAEANQKVAGKGYKGGITEALTRGEYGDALKLTAMGFTESLPLLVGMVASRGAGLSGESTLIGMGLGSQGTAYQDLKEQHPEIDKNILFLNAALTGIGEAGSEITGTNLLYNQAKKLFTSGAKEEAKKAVTEGIKSYLDNAFKKSFVGSAALADMTGEVANQVWKNAADKWSGVRPDVEYLDGVGDAAILSLATTGTIAGGLQGVSKIINPKIKTQVTADTEAIQRIQAEIENPNVPEETKSILLNEVGTLTEKVNDSIEKDNTDYNALTDDQKGEVDILTDKADQLESALNDANVSDETKKVLEPQVKAINNQIEKIKPETPDSTVQSAVIEIGGKLYEGNNHAEAILKAKADGQDISQVNRAKEGKFKLSDGTIIGREEAKTRFGQDRSELLIPQDEAADQANKDYKSEVKAQSPAEIEAEVMPEELKSDSDIEKRMSEIEGDSDFNDEFNSLEKEMQKRERESVFNVPLSEVGKSVDSLMQKEKEMPNGFGSFIEKRDASETKEVADKYLNPKEITDAELKKDFKDAVLGNPDTWYADGLKLRESMNEASNRGIDVKDLVAEIEKQYVKDGYTEAEARRTVAIQLKPIFEGSQKVNEKQIAQKEPTPTKKTLKQLEQENKSTLPKVPATNEASSKEKQLEIIQKSNPAPNDINTWVRTVDDIKTAEEAFSVAFTEGEMYPDFTTADMNTALELGQVTVYSSFPIKDGVFVTASKMNAEEYGGGRGSKVYSEKVNINDIAWIDEGEGQYAPVETVSKEVPVTPKVEAKSEPIEESSATPKDDVAKAVDKKAEELKAKSSDALLKEQKKDMLDQLSEVEKALQGDNDAIAIQNVKDLGYEVNENDQVVIDVKEDGVFKIHVDGISDAITEVKKQFPDKNFAPKDYKPKLSGTNGKGKTTVTQLELDNAKENLATATKSGNTKLQEVFQKEADRLSKLEVVENKPKPKEPAAEEKQVVAKTKRELATEARKEAQAKLKARNERLGIYDDPKEKAKAYYDYHKALVTEAKEYILEGIDSVEKFAKEIGEKVTKVVQDAWDEATGGKKLTVEDFEEKQDNSLLSEDELNVMGITKKDLNAIEDSDADIASASRAEAKREAKRLVAEGYNIKDLINRIKKPTYAPLVVEMDILRDYYVSLTARNNANPTPELIKELADLRQLILDTGLRMGRSVQAFDGVIAIEDNLSSFLSEESEWVELSKEEVVELAEKYNKAQEALKRLQEKEEEAVKKANDKKAQKNIDEVKAKQRGSIKEGFKERQVQLREELRDALRKARNTHQVTFVPYAYDLIVATPIVKKMVDNYVNEKIYDLKTIIEGIHKDLQDDIPDLTQEDVRDMIAGKYPNPRKTKNAKLAEIRELETQARLEAKIEDLEKGILTTSNPSARRNKSDRIEELEKQIKEIKRRNPELTAPSKLQGRKTWFTNRIEELKDQIAKNDFDAAEPPTPILLDAEALKLKDEYAKFKEETIERRQKKEYEALANWEKGLKIAQGLGGLRRTVNVSVDLSIPFRQGWDVMLNPRTAKIGAEAYLHMVKSVKSRVNYNRMMVDIERSPAYLESKDDGIVYNEVGSSENIDEWHNSSGIVNKIPVVRELVKGSEVAAAAWTNYARYELYKLGTKRLLKQGKTRENAKSAYEDMAARVMVDTGRGKLPIISDKTPSKEGSVIKWISSAVLFGPRLYAATFRKLNPFYYLNIGGTKLGKKLGMKSVDRTVRIEALKDMAGYTGSLIALGLLAVASGATISFDPDDPDFLKARWGKRVIDLTAGHSVYIRTYLRVVRAAIMRVDPDVSKADADKYADFASKSVQLFWRNKLEPNSAYAANWYFGSNTIGEKFDPWEIIKIYPMYTDDIIKSFKEGNPLDAALILPIGISGLGYQEYSRDIKKARVSLYIGPKDKELKSFLKNHQLNITGDINQEVFDLNAFATVKMTPEQSAKYEKVWSEHVIEGIKAEMPELEKMAVIDKKHDDEKGYHDKVTAEISQIKAEATKIAKEAIGGVAAEMLTIRRDDPDTGEAVTYTLSKEQVMERLDLVKQYKDKPENRITPSLLQAIKREDRKTEAEARIIAEKELQSDANSYATDLIYGTDNSDARIKFLKEAKLDE